MSKNNSKKAYQLVKDLTSSKQRGSSVIQDKKGESLTEENDVRRRWTEYCAELYNYKTTGDQDFTNTHESTDTDSDDILRYEVEAAIRDLKKDKSAGVDNIPGKIDTGWRGGNGQHTT